MTDVDMRLMWRGLTWRRRHVMVEINVFWWISMRRAVDVAGVDMARRCVVVEINVFWWISMRRGA